MFLKADPAERRQQFLELYELYLDGLTLRQIGARYNVSRECVRQVFKKYATQEEFKTLQELADKRRARTWQTTEAIALLEAGNTCSKVAKLLNISLSAVKRLSAQYNKQKDKAQTC